MKVCICLHRINNPGGIINHTEDLYIGFKELGHEVDFKIMCYQDKLGKYRDKPEDLLKTDKWEIGKIGVPVCQERGWMDTTGNIRLLYKGEKNRERVREILSKYDLIVWESTVTEQKENRGNTDWIELHNIPVKQVSLVHDWHLKENYPFINEIKSHLSGLVCVHTDAYTSAEVIDIPRALIPNPFNIEDMNTADNWGKRDKGFFSVQTFKNWKHVDDIVRAVPYMDKDYKKILAGGGIQYSYMTSKTKAKPQYYLSKKYDPDLPDELDKCGKKIFDYALENGMQSLWWISNKVRDRYLDSLRFLINPAWSNKPEQKGGSVDRTVMEAMLKGTIPIARNYGISNNAEGKGLLLNPDVNYLMIPHDTTPKQFANYVNEYMNISESKANEIRNNNFEIMRKYFDRRKIAQQIIDLSEGKPCGIYNKIEVGVLDKELEMNSEKEIREFFGKEK